MERYDYQTPPGYGDTFYVYAFDVDASGANIPAGTNGLNQRIAINDGQFVARWWRGACQYGNAGTGVQIRDRLQNRFFSDTLQLNPAVGNAQAYQNTGMAIMPETIYPDSGYIGLDIYGALPTPTQPGQLAFHGVRRRRGIQNDPMPSQYKYYEKPYGYQTTAVIPMGWSSASGGYLVTIPIADGFDFELRRIDGFISGAAVAASRQFGDDQSVVLVTAVTPGVGGNAIQLVLDSTAGWVPNQPDHVTVVGNIITFFPATDSLGHFIYNPPIAGTNLQMLQAFASSSAASALVTMSLYSGPLTSSGWGKIPSPGNLQGGGASTGAGTYCGLDLGNYKILLLDTNQIQVSNVPLLFSNLFHVPNNAVSSYGVFNTNAANALPRNFWPTPAMLYRTNSSIRFYLYVTSATPLASPVSMDILFSGVRRYPCH